MEEIYKRYFTETSHSILIVSFDMDVGAGSSIPILAANPSFIHMFSCSTAPLVLQETFANDFEDITEKLIKALEVSKKNIRIILPEIERSYEISFSYLGNNIVSIDFLDVSDQAEDLRLLLAEQALQKSQMRYSLLLEKMKNIFVSFRIQEKDGILEEISYSDANPSFESFLGATRADLMGKSPIGTFITDDAEEIQEKIFQTYLTGIPSHFILENNLLGIYLDASLYRFDETIVAMVASNITELKQTEYELRIAKDKAEESDRLKSSFLANMSHEIRTPLNGILGFSKLLARTGLSEEKKNHYISLIDNNGDHLMSIISDILDIAKIESNQLEINTNDIMLNSLFDSLMEMSNTMVSKKEKEQISVTTSKGLPSALAILNTDPLRLTQILRNLIENAIKFTQTGSVNFGYKEYGDNHLYFYVKDTGIGISKENLQVIFQHFRQEDETITRKFGGTGLGLSICKHLVKHLGGEIGVESEKGKGSTFYFILPYEKIKKTNLVEIRQETLQLTTQNINIACFGSTHAFDFCMDAMQNSNIDLTTYNDLPEFREQCLTGKFHAAIIDITRSGIQTTEILAEIKNEMPFFPVFAVTNNLVESDRSFYARLGYNDVFELNADTSTICSRIKYYLDV